MKNILILTGSAHWNGTSLLLANEFEKGAKSSRNVEAIMVFAFKKMTLT